MEALEQATNKDFYEKKDWLGKIQSFMSRPWYVPLIGILAALDFFVFIFPVDFLLLTRIIFRKEDWLRTIFLVAVGAAFGAFLLTFLVQSDMAWVLKLFGHGDHPSSHEWIRISEFIHRHGVLGVLIATLTLIPLPLVVAVAAWEKVSLVSIVGVVFLGRSIRYFIYGILAIYFPQVAHTIYFSISPKKLVKIS